MQLDENYVVIHKDTLQKIIDWIMEHDYVSGTQALEELLGSKGSPEQIEKAHRKAHLFL